MSEVADVGSIPDEQRCKRSDGRKWRCRRPVMEGKGYCETHMQGIRRQKKRPKPEENFNAGSSGLEIKRGKTIKIEDSVSDQPEVVKELKFGRMEIEGAASPLPSQQKAVKRRAKKSGASSTSSVPGKAIGSKNTGKIVPSVKAAAKKITKKCHWCKLSSYCVLVKCSTCKEQFFCKDCINKRFYCKKSIMRECPVCQGDCPCDTCTRRNSKKLKAKEPVIYDLEEDEVICDTESEKTVSNLLNKFDFRQHLHMIGELLPVMEKMNQEKIIELEIEAKNKGISHDALQVQVVRYPQKNECSFCNAGIVDAHRSCPYCPYIICIHCSQEFRDGYLHSSLENIKTTKIVRTKKPRKISWRFHVHGKIRCPPKSLGGCGEGFLKLASFFPFSFTKDLEESAKQMVSDYKFMKSYGLSESSLCLLCNKSDEMCSEKVGNVIGNKNKELYFSTKQEFREKNLEHFMKHWGNGQPLIIQDMLRSQPDVNWDSVYILREYLQKSMESREKTETGKTKHTSDWCEVDFRRKQIFSAGKTHENVWNEFLKFKLRFSSGFLQDHLPNHYNAVIESLPVQEYFNPFTGFLNLAVKPEDETENCNLGSYVSISYGGLEKENPTDADLLSNLRCHAYDVVNVLVHATAHSIPERILNEVKVLMNKYNSQDHLKSSSKIAKRNKLDKMFASSSRLDDTCENDVDLTTIRLENTRNNEEILASDESESESESDDEDISEDVDRCGAQWDVFRREDVPKLLDYLRKYNDKLSGSYGYPKKVVHPLFDEVFYLNDDHKTRLKEEFNVEAWSFEQNVGDAFITPAGCPYQIKKVKSCVNVVIEFMSPESASECIKLSDEVRLLPVNHKAKGNMVQVRKMVINRMQKTIEEMREVSQIE